MPTLLKILFYALAGALGGSAAWVFILSLHTAARGGLLTELMLGAVAGIFIGGFIWSHEAITGRQFQAAAKRAAFGAIAGILGGAAGAALGSTVFTAIGRFIVKSGGLNTSIGIAFAVGLGWAVLGAAVGASGGIIIRSRERFVYGLFGGAIGGFLGGVLFYSLSATSIWSALAGLFLLGMCIGAFISLVEEAMVGARVKVIKGRHVGREFPILKALSSIGRDDRADVCLSGAEGVGLEHAYIKKKKHGFSIEQGQGGTGVYVNHQKTDHARLSNGDVIRVGSIMLLFSTVRKAAVVIGMLFLFSASQIFSGPAWAADARSVKITQFDLSGYPTVKTYVSILDGNGKAVRGLGKHNVALKENGVPVRVKEMKVVRASGDREPLSLALVIDKSGSMAGNKITQAKASVLRFISLMEKGDRASLFAFSDDVVKAESLTRDREKLKKSAGGIQTGGNTALYDAIAQGVDSVQRRSGRRAVIVLSDGISNRGVYTIERAIEHATKSYVSVYVIGLGADVRTARLERIAHKTGGTYFFTPSAEGLLGIYETISRRIKNEYVVSYDTKQRGTYLRNVDLRIVRGPGTKRAYFQPESSLFGAGGSMPGWAFLIPLVSMVGLVGVSLRNIERQYSAGHLSVVSGRASRKEIDVSANVTLGRDERNAVGLFKDNQVAQYHAEVRKVNGAYVVADKGTSAGTYVNRNKVSGERKLADGDVIGIGGFKIVFSQGRQRTCSGCKGPIRGSSKFCPKCGTKNG